MPMEFYAACEGYFERKKEDTLVIRFASYRVAESMAGTKALGNIENFWPIEPKKAPEQMSKERVEAIFKRHNIQIG